MAAQEENNQQAQDLECGGNAELERDAAGSAVASRIVGGAADGQGVDRDELIARGMSNHQVDNVQVQVTVAEVLRQYIQRWLLCFIVTLIIVVCISVGFLIWLILSWNHARYAQLSCDAPLIEWVTVVYVVKVYMFFLHKVVVRCVFRYDPPRNVPGPAPPPPWYVKMYNLAFPVFDFVWNIVGIVLCATSTTCSDNMPNVYSSIIAFASCGLFIGLWMLVNAVGLQVILVYMMRNGMIRSAEHAAPKETLGQQVVVPYAPDAFGENPQCSICLEDFTASKEIRQTTCGHHYHTSCLKGWLNVQRTCPLCRTDLTTGQTIGAGEEP